MATNRLDILDDALIRPGASAQFFYLNFFTYLKKTSGRIDRKIEFPNPNEKAREDILKIHVGGPCSVLNMLLNELTFSISMQSRKMNLMRGIDLAKIAEKLPGASGAEIKAVCTEAGMYALRERRVHVTQEDFEMAVAKVWKLYRCLLIFIVAT